MGGNAFLQAPHLPVSATCRAGIRFCFPHEGQLRMMGMTDPSFSSLPDEHTMEAITS
jgi:hypothetical protein